MKRKKKPAAYPAWMYQRSMTPMAFEIVIAALGMTQEGAGRFLGVSGRTARRYVEGTAMIGAAEVMLLQGMLERGEKPLVPKAPKD